MKKIICISFLLILITGQVFGWGQNGHRVVGLVAQQHLTKKARQQVLKILQQNSLAEVSNWMDDIKSDASYNHTHDWHWVTIPDGMKYEQTEKNPQGDVVMKTEELVTELKKKNLPADKQQEAIKYLVHLIGDLHQPLHVGRPGDTGGNTVKVQWFSQSSNLHRVWDSDMIEGKDLSYTELASFLNAPDKNAIKAWQASTIREWAYESMNYRPQVYNVPADGKLGYRYSYDNFATVEHRLLQAGIRLAGVLNTIFG
jgi:hypothetical protein